MSIRFSKRGRNIIISLDGEIDHHSVEELKCKIDREYERCGARNIIFDFRRVSFMDSSGIGMIIGRYKNVENQGGAVYAANIDANVRKIFEISGLTRLIKCCGSIEDAERAAEGGIHELRQ